MRLATAWLGGCSGYPHEFPGPGRAADRSGRKQLSWSTAPRGCQTDVRKNVDITLVEGAVANVDHLELAEQIRRRSKES